MKTIAAVAIAGFMVLLAGCESSCTSCAKPAAPAKAVCSTCPYTPIVPAVLTAETPYPASIEGTYVPMVRVDRQDASSVAN